MTIKATVALNLVLLGSAGCQTYDVADDVAARILAPGDASRAELQHVVNDALGTDVSLAMDALTQNSILTIERSQPATMQNPRPQGRVMDMPVQFRLVKNHDSCFLIDQRDGKRFLLQSADCVAE